MARGYFDAGRAMAWREAKKGWIVPTNCANFTRLKIGG